MHIYSTTSVVIIISIIVEFTTRQCAACDGLQVAYEPITKVNREFDSCRTHFLLREIKKEKKKKEEASPQGKNRAMWGEEAKPLKHKNDAERKSDL